MLKRFFKTEIMRKLLLSIFILISSTSIFAQDFGGRNPFKAMSEPNAAVTYNNPVIPGFYSDPSVCRVGEDYYLVTSTFGYFPGVPVFHSKDLVNWEQIGHCIHRKEQMPKGLNIYAPTIRHNNGTFYMITTTIGPKFGSFYVSATNPTGPWSDPIWVKAGMIDPDLFFDDDGKSYFISSDFKLYEIDIETGKLLTAGQKIWNGTGGRHPEGPHIYKKDGFYYLMAAEGGTEEAHSETIARSNNIWGPYFDNPANPILAHANAAGQGNPIQGVGHADIIQAHDGLWWIMFHGYRSVSGVNHILGRETCLAPVSWPKNGWPVVNGNGTASVDMTFPTLPLKLFKEKPTKIDFDNDELGLEWNYIQIPDYEKFSLSDRPGFLRLKGSANQISGSSSPIKIQHTSPTFVGRRLTDLYFTATTQIEFNPKNENEEAGIVLLNNGYHFDLMINKKEGNRILVVKLQFDQIIYKSEEIVLKSGSVKLRVKGEKTKFTFSYTQGNDEYIEIETVASKFLSSETVGGFTGTYVGLYATGNGEASKTFADYDWFEYIKHEAPAQNNQWGIF